MALSSPFDVSGKLIENIVLFTHLLRRAGVNVSFESTKLAIESISSVGVENRDQFFWALHTSLLTRPEDRDIFKQAFAKFWKDPKILDKMLAMMLADAVQSNDADKGMAENDVSKRLAEALADKQDVDHLPDREEFEQIEFDAAMTASAENVSRTQDFEQMSITEFMAAKKVVEKIFISQKPVKTRRLKSAQAGSKINLRHSLQSSMREPEQNLVLRYSTMKTRIPKLVVLCDISGSMERYARMMLHMLHALVNYRKHVEVFLFSTTLYHVTKELELRDPDKAMDAIMNRVDDWLSGTQITQALTIFNKDWSRRILSQGAEVLLITDGLERDDPSQLSFQAERLHKSVRRLIWLNPLLRYDDFLPIQSGTKALMPFVDDFRPVHNLESLEQLASVLSRPNRSRSSQSPQIKQWIKLSKAEESDPLLSRVS